MPLSILTEELLDLLDHCIALSCIGALTLPTLSLRMDQFPCGFDDDLEVARGAWVLDWDNIQLAGELVVKRYCEGIEVALNKSKAT